MKIINKTPHPITVKDKHGKFFTYPPVDPPIRLEEKRFLASELNDCNNEAEFNLYYVSYRSTSLPPVEDGVFYIVSYLVAEMYEERVDFIFPGKAIRDENGFIVACKGFSIV